MTDKELLIAAAKAAGVTLTWNYLGDQFAGKEWDPLNDDGAALRLAIDLGFKIETPKYKGFGTQVGNQVVFRDDPYEQTRRAIVLYAASKAVPQ